MLNWRSQFVLNTRTNLNYKNYVKKLRLFITIFAGLIFLIVIIYFVIGSLRPKIAGLFINTNPASVVWINGREVGKTPYRSTTKPGEAIIKLIPNSSVKQLVPYETKTDLIAGVETVVRYDFATNDELASGDIISFEKDERGQTSLIAVSMPDLAIIIIDGTQRAFAPYKTTSITPGDHELKFSLEGYRDRLVKVKIYQGYKLTAIIKLAKISGGNTEPESVSVTPTPGTGRDMVEILSTPTGYLRVRKEPSSIGDEVGRVNPGERYPLVEIDTKTGWYKIEFQPAQTGSSAKEGWVSSQYAKKILVNQVGSQTPTPTAKVSTSSASITKKPTPTPIVDY